MIHKNQNTVLQQLSPENPLEERGLLEDTLQYYQDGLVACPDNADLWYGLGTTLLELSRLPEAVQALQQAILLKPDLAGAYINLGYAFNQQAQPENALRCYQNGLLVCPENADLWFSLGSSLSRLARLSESVQALQQAIALKPDFAAAYINLGNTLKDQGLTEDAIQCYQNGLVVCPYSAELLFNLGTDLSEVPRLSEAVQAFEQAIALKPDFAGAYINLGNILKDQGLSENAIQCYQEGLAVCPDNADLWFNLGTDLSELSRLSKAVEAFQQAIALKPDFTDAYINLGNVFIELQRLPEAVAAFQQAIALQPDFADAYCNLGNALQLQGNARDAILAYDRAIALNPANEEVYYNRATAILLSGDLARGFAEYECRTHIKRFHHFYEWCDDLPRWCGESFSGKRLLIFHEQGFGDALQFCRYLPLVKAGGGVVQFSTKKPLLRLFSNFPGIDELIDHSAETIAGAQPDLAVPLMSLPYIFGTTLATIPVAVPFPAAIRHLLKKWRSKIDNPAANLRVGLVWAGSPAHIPGQIRTCGLQVMAPLADIPGVTFYSLQKGEAANQAHTPPPKMQLIDLTEDIADFADTAGLIMNLDLVIAVDTAVAHLAGALGKPVWTLLPAAGEWRWLLARNDTPWYPAMRLFRQSAPGGWSSVMTAVAQKLRMWKQV